ncbi:hypothetical protein Taro_011970 [Colocasia esculenta]|uniref:Uncharacterized protein n=1 Tax=Colocasia esculenta TaxID=4460 RepID=A0A843U7N9_COLES|nr:hypothetical protein [Colocasia esculenta]
MVGCSMATTGGGGVFVQCRENERERVVGERDTRDRGGGEERRVRHREEGNERGEERQQTTGDRGKNVIISNQPYFYKKAELFPGSVFVIGADTAVRLIDM